MQYIHVPLSGMTGHPHLVEETNNLARNVLASGLFVVHDTGAGGQDNISELTRRQ